MRVLPILMPDGSLDEYATVAIQSCMIFPDDLESIDEDRLTFRILLENRIPNKRFIARQEDDWKAALIGGLYTGSMLMLIVQFKIFYPDFKVGMNKSAFFNAVAAQSFPKKLSKDISTIKKYWDKYKNAAHLWAALMVVLGRFGEEGQHRSLTLPIDFTRVVDIADQLADAAQHNVEGWNPWRLPEFSPIQRTNYDIPRPDGDAVKLVRSYRAK